MKARQHRQLELRKATFSVEKLLPFETTCGRMDILSDVVKRLRIIPQYLVNHLGTHVPLRFHPFQRIDFSGRIDVAIVSSDQ